MSDESTLEIMFEECRSGQTMVNEWVDAIDAKVLGIFGAASVLIGAVPAIGGVKAHGWDWTPWVVAGVAWLIASFFCWKAFTTREYLLSPDPTVILQAAWLNLSPMEYRRYRIRDLGKAWKQNKCAIDKKAEALGRALPFIGIESASLLAALLLQ